MHATSRFLAAALLLLALAAPTRVAAQTGRLEGVVTGARGKQPVDDAVVTLSTLAGGQPVGRDTTGDDGAFAFDVAVGEYSLRIEHDDYQNTGMKVFVVADTTTTVTATLFRPDRLFSSLHFEPHEPNYFLFGTDGPSDESGYHEQVKFRIAVRYALASLARYEGETGLYAAYTQDSFWHLYDESAPFYDNNYAPEALLYVDARDVVGKVLSRYVPSVRVYFRHQSNGRGGDDSRSWNRLGGGVEWGSPANRVQHFSINAWKVVSDAPQNRDIRRTNGAGEVRLDLAPFIDSGFSLDRFGVSVRSRIFGTQVFENVEIDGYFRLPELGIGFQMPPSIMVQAFCGRGEVLLDHRTDRCAIRAGIAIIS